MKKVRLLLPSGCAIVNQSLNMSLGQYGINVNNFLLEFNELSNKSFDKGVYLCVDLSIIDNKNYNFKINSFYLPFILKSLKKENLQISDSDLYYILIYFLSSFDLFYLEEKKKSILKSIKGTLKSFNK